MLVATGLTAAVMVVVGIWLFMTADRPFNGRGVAGLTTYISGWLIGILMIV